MENKIVQTLRDRVTAIRSDNERLLLETFPRDLGSVTAAWLSGLMERKVLSFEARALEMGVLSDLGVVTMQYEDNGADKPSSIVMKFAKGVDASRAGAVAAKSYIKEVHFFQDFAGKVPLNVPKVHGVFQDPAAPEEYFCIVMEDLSIGHEPMDQTAGITLEEQKKICETPWRAWTQQ